MTNKWLDGDCPRIIFIELKLEVYYEMIQNLEVIFNYFNLLVDFFELGFIICRYHNEHKWRQTTEK